MNTNKNLDEIINTIKAWLMIYNNYDNLKLPNTIDPAAIDIRIFLLELYQESIIIIIRLSQVRIGYLIQIRKLSDIYDSLEILLIILRQKELLTSKNILDLVLYF
jgi:hypothetical protein